MEAFVNVTQISKPCLSKVGITSTKLAPAILKHLGVACTHISSLLRYSRSTLTEAVNRQRQRICYLAAGINRGHLHQPHASSTSHPGPLQPLGLDLGSNVISSTSSNPILVAATFKRPVQGFQDKVFRTPETSRPRPSSLTSQMECIQFSPYYNTSSYPYSRFVLLSNFSASSIISHSFLSF